MVYCNYLFELGMFIFFFNIVIVWMGNEVYLNRKRFFFVYNIFIVL